MAKASEKHLVLGHNGEVGSAIFKILKERFEVYGVDRTESAPAELERSFDCLHACFPHSEQFVAHLREYKAKWLKGGGLIIIHSTVPVGTSRTAGAVHSPIRGVHPHLVRGIKTFVKYFGGERALEAAAIFERVGIRTRTTPKPESTEALKLWDTTYYGWNIVFNKEVKRYCDERGLDFDIVYADANETYNEGYAKLGRPDVVRPVLKHAEGPIGGHCVISNCRLLGGEVAETILNLNEQHAEAKKEEKPILSPKPSVAEGFPS